jgi:uncharacterized protein (TIGR03437 family)
MKLFTSRLLTGWIATAFLAFAQTPSYYIVSTIAGAGKYAYPGDGRSAASVPLFEPERVAFDRAGNLYFTESYYCRVFRISTSGILTTVAGTGECTSSGDGGPATSAGLSDAAGIALDAAGNIYVGDRYRLRRISADRTIRTIAGTGVLGYSGDGGLATSAQIGTPGAITVDASNTVYFSDPDNHVVWRISPFGAITRVAGTGSPGFSNEGGPARSASLNDPSGLAVDADGNLYIADFGNNRVRRVSPDGVITTIAGTGQPGYTGDSRPAVEAQLFGPNGLALDGSGNLFIAETTLGVIRRVASNGLIYTVARVPAIDIASSPAGDFAVVENVGRVVHRMRADGYLSVMAGFISTTAIGDNGPASSAVLLAPFGIGVDPKGSLFVADFSDQRVRRINPDGMIATIAGNGISNNTGDGSLAVNAQLNQPNPLAVDSSGNVLVACNTRIRRIDISGIIATVVGTGDVGYAGDNGPATNARIYFPRGLAFDSAGNLYIADTRNHRVRRVTRDGVITTIAGNGQQGYFGNGVAATTAQLNNPMGVAVDASGNVYIADSDNHRVRKLSTAGIITDFAGDGQPDNTGDGGPAVRARLLFPRSVAVDPAGNVLITSDTLVRRVSQSGVITTIAGSGVREYSGDGDLATRAGMEPTALAVDRTGRIYVSDTLNTRIRQLDPAQIFPSGVLHGATFQAGPVAPGEIATFFGADLGPAELARGSFDPGGVLAKAVAEVQITFDGTPAPLLYVSAAQASAIVPYSLAGRSSTVVQVTYRGRKSNAITLPVAKSSPGIFTASASGRGPGAILNQDATLNTASNPAAPGSIIVFWATGEGQTAPAGLDGKLAADLFPKPILPVSVSIGGKEAEILYAAAAPGMVAGVMQVNARVPVNVTPSDAVPIRLKVGDTTSPEGVTVALR